MKLTEEQIESHKEENQGYCTECKAISGDHVEPDAEHYECEECGNESVMGIDMAVIEGHIEIVDEEESDDDESDFEGDEEY